MRIDRKLEIERQQKKKYEKKNRRDERRRGERKPAPEGEHFSIALPLSLYMYFITATWMQKLPLFSESKEKKKNE